LTFSRIKGVNLKKFPQSFKAIEREINKQLKIEKIDADDKGGRSCPITGLWLP